MITSKVGAGSGGITSSNSSRGFGTGAGSLTGHDTTAVTSSIARSGLDSRGPNMLGGSAFDDFNGDGRPDILVLSGDWDRGGSLFVNRGDGRFEERFEKISTRLFCGRAPTRFESTTNRVSFA